MSWTAEWSGSFPNLCFGTWTLYKDGAPIDTSIPFQNEEAGTFGEYATWSFGSDWNEVWDHYEDGLDCDAWCREYADWLSTIAPQDEWSEIYEAFQAQDWRHNSCGGCI